MKNYKLCHIGEESSKSKNTSVRRQANQQEKHIFKWFTFHIV